MSNDKNKLKVHDNFLWDMLDDGSKLAVLDIIMNNGIEGNVRLIGVIKEGASNLRTVIKVENDCGVDLELPVDILDILNR